jgi:hypothetical protein
MTTQFSNNILKYQKAASSQVINAVKTAAKKTGADFSFLMQKAAAESSFNPAAKAKTSSATGLFQFIEQTWLDTVAKHGDKHGLGREAAQIEMKNGRAHVADPKARQAILNLRKDPAISALMAGEFCADNQDYLKANTSCEVGATELYFAHFMGAGGAAKFLNSRDINGDALGAQLFPQAAKANRSIFYDRATGQPKTLDQIYDTFARKFSPDGTSPALTAAKGAPSAPAAGSVEAPSAPVAPLSTVAEALALSEETLAKLPSFEDGNDADDIVWNDDPRFYGTLSRADTPLQKLSPVTIMVMTQMQETLTGLKESQTERQQRPVREAYRYNS